MKLVFLTHPTFLSSQSMPRYANWLSQGMKDRGHETEVISPEPVAYNLPVPKSLKKWMGYIDQYILFPKKIRSKFLDRSETLFVFTDHALGPWVPLFSDLPHVIHCHDFLAQHSALGRIPENPTNWSGKKYQSFIRRGYNKGKNFISISQKTQKDLHGLISQVPPVSEVIYNGLAQPFAPVMNAVKETEELGKALNLNLSEGFILNVAGNQWYKNRRGVIEIYSAWRDQTSSRIPLVLVGAVPNSIILDAFHASDYREDIHFISGLSDINVRKAYATASLFLFPSLDEGFGWPIAEAMASGCPTITTDRAPMNEVAGDAGFLIARRPIDSGDVKKWAETSARKITHIMKLSPGDRERAIALGIENSLRFSSSNALNQIESLYTRILAQG